jgi:3-oxoacyl-[acyl-carrier-protein] synthase-3
METQKAFIKGISYYLPETIFTNKDFYSLFPEAVSNKENLDMIGVEQRRITKTSETASDLAVKSALQFFKEHKVEPSEIDFLLFCAQEFDYYGPTSACIIHEKIGLPKNCGALDFNLGCSGFVYGLSLAKGMIESIGVKNVMLITSSTLTKKFHPKDKSSRYVFGDGAAATLISSRSAEEGIGKFIFGTDGKGANKIIVKDGGARNPISDSSFVESADEYGNVTNAACYYMDGPGVFIFGLKTVPKMINELLEKEQKKTDDIDLFIFHQANLFLIDHIRKKLHLSEEKIFNFMGEVGNTVSSSIPIALAEAIKAGKAKKGQTILLAGFGVGLSWAATTIRL